jgi:hypothetical protein
LSEEKLVEEKDDDAAGAAADYGVDDGKPDGLGVARSRDRSLGLML